jgi:hypothetical protein
MLGRLEHIAQDAVTKSRPFQEGLSTSVSMRVSPQPAGARSVASKRLGDGIEQP